MKNLKLKISELLDDKLLEQKYNDIIDGFMPFNTYQKLHSATTKDELISILEDLYAPSNDYSVRKPANSYTAARQTQQQQQQPYQQTQQPDRQQQIQQQKPNKPNDMQQNLGILNKDQEISYLDKQGQETTGVISQQPSETNPNLTVKNDAGQQEIVGKDKIKDLLQKETTTAGGIAAAPAPMSNMRKRK